MAEQDLFTKLLNTEFRWPKEGDNPFQASKDWTQNASVENDVRSRCVLMTTGYKMGADLMVDRGREDSFDRDCLVYAILFNYRHFIELSLKNLIDWYGPFVGIVANWNSHNLADLWIKFKSVMERYGNHDPQGTMPVVEQIIVAFAKIDPGSYSNRYPVDTTGKPIPVAIAELDLNWLKDVVNGVDGFFTGCDGYLDSLKSAAH